MNKNVIILISFFFLSCINGEKPVKYDNDYYEISDFSPTDKLVRVSVNEYELGEDFCYLNQKGDTVIPYGRFTHSFSDTIITFGIVVEKTGDRHDLIGINQKGQRLYEIHWFDNGPDYIEEGLFRILRDGKTGFADTTGKIVIEPQFECAEMFVDGQAKVTFDCVLEKDLDHTIMKSDSWFYIDRKGLKIK